MNFDTHTVTGTMNETPPIPGPFNFVPGDAVNLGGLYTWFYSLDGELLRAGYYIVNLATERRNGTQKEGAGQVGAVAIYQRSDIAQNDIIFP